MVTNARSDVRSEIEEVRRELEHDQPELADRLARVVERLGPRRVDDPSQYMSTGAAAARLGVSPNTVKKWVRTGVIRDFWVLPGSGYVKVAASDIERLRGATTAEES